MGAGCWAGLPVCAVAPLCPGVSACASASARFSNKLCLSISMATGEEPTCPSVCGCAFIGSNSCVTEAGAAVPTCRPEEGESGPEGEGARAMVGGTAATETTPVARVTLGAG